MRGNAIPATKSHLPTSFSMCLWAHISNVCAIGYWLLLVSCSFFFFLFKFISLSIVWMESECELKKEKDRKNSISFRELETKIISHLNLKFFLVPIALEWGSTQWWFGPKLNYFWEKTILKMCSFFIAGHQSLWNFI